MTDLEITKLCAEAMGLTPTDEISEWTEYDPLHDDAQAMALVKRFELDLTFTGEGFNKWNVQQSTLEAAGVFSYQSDLNRAICECVAKMQKEKT